MIKPSVAGAFVALAALSGLASCGNDTSQTERTQVFRLVLSGALAGSREAQPQVVSIAQINQVLATKPEPLALVTVEDRKASALVIQIEQNGPYRTYATPQRQTLTFRRGMITATRGLGGDLMSSEEDALLALVTRKSSGTVPYVQRYLTGEDVTVTLNFTCAVSPGGTAPVNLGQVNTVAQVMNAQCSGAAGSFTNTFLVDGAGDIVSARQWLGELSGYVGAQQLRK